MSNIPKLVKDILSSQPVVIPVFNRIALQLHQKMKEQTYEINDIVDLIHEDQALASEMLRYANSAYNSGKMPITTIRNAVIRLGSQQIVNLAFAASLATTRSNNQNINTYMTNLWRHCYAVANASAALAFKIRHDKNMPELDPDEVYLAGLLHDIGKLYLLKVIDWLITTDMLRPGNAIIDEMLDELNIEQGLRVMASLNLPDIYANAIERLCIDDWQCGSNDYLVAAVRLSSKVHESMERGILSADAADDSAAVNDFKAEMELLEVDDSGYLCSLIGGIDDGGYLETAPGGTG
ncbi:HDOD domain-containing protein [Geobacter sp. AOG2]|uniref:HDOD domain-containing protein n=1 Tax=Geobacter sp. AOG2 TaxID=1566347 RepID=UPI001CC71E1C|nr:HDOD domain-containing protein [Geobacter sp. AOG2]